MMFNKKTRSATGWEAGDIWFPRMYVSAGEKVQIEVELNWNRPGITKDWSVTSWGESGHVTVLHDDGIPSDHLPYTPRCGGCRADVKYSKPTSYSSIQAPVPAPEPAYVEPEPAYDDSLGFGSYSAPKRVTKPAFEPEPVYDDSLGFGSYSSTLSKYSPKPVSNDNLSFGSYTSSYSGFYSPKPVPVEPVLGQ